MPTILVKISLILFIGALILPDLIMAKDKVVSSKPDTIDIFDVSEKDIPDNIEIPDVMPDFSSFEENTQNDNFIDDLFIGEEDQNSSISPSSASPEIINTDNPITQKTNITNKVIDKLIDVDKDAKNVPLQHNDIQNVDNFNKLKDDSSNQLPSVAKDAVITDDATEGVITAPIVDKESNPEDIFKSLLFKKNNNAHPDAEAIFKTESIAADNETKTYRILHFHLNNFLNSFENKDVASGNILSTESHDDISTQSDQSDYIDDSTINIGDNDDEYYNSEEGLDTLDTLEDEADNKNLDQIASLPDNNNITDIGKENTQPKPDNNKLSGLDYAKSALDAGQISAAISVYKEVLKTEPDNIKALLGLALAYKENLQHKQSKAIYDKIITIDPNNKEALDKLTP